MHFSKNVLCIPPLVLFSGMESEWFEFLIITLLIVCRVDWIAGKKDINHETTSIMLTFPNIDGTRELQKDLRQCNGKLYGCLTLQKQMDCWW